MTRPADTLRPEAPRRAEIQALRAIAVSAVVVYHLWPAALQGGFVGVDVFFVISGFLITAGLLREVEATGRVSLARFWARRARRLLPAALLTIVCCAVATLALVPPLRWEELLAEMRAAALYVQNLQLAAGAVDYLHAADSPSPVQHFWSLSVEEQFYLVWPLLVLGCALATRRATAAVRRWTIGAVLAAVTLSSLAYSVAATASNPAAAYFSTPVRAWEFGAGGLLAVLGPSLPRLPGWLLALASWAGLAGIAFAVVVIDAGTAFPSWRALEPVLATLAVIHAGLPRSPLSPAPILRLVPVQLAGDISYAAYLWHWPLIVLAPYAVRDAGSDATPFAILAITVLAAVLTRALVENPIRRAGRRGSWRPRGVLAATAAATSVVLLVVAAGAMHLRSEVRAARDRQATLLAAHPPCFGAAARDVDRPCRNLRLVHEVLPAPILAVRGQNAPCAELAREGELSVCRFGAPPEVATDTVGLVGDSHAGHWRSALAVVARERRWRGISITHTGCPFSAATRVLPEPDRSSCLRWNRALPRYVRRHPEISTLFVVGKAVGAVEIRRGQSMFTAKVDGYLRAWATLPSTVRRIVVIRDTPRTTFGTLECVERAMAATRVAGSACATRRPWALPLDPAAVAAHRLRSSRVRVVDFSTRFCSRRSCFPVIGGALVYKDSHHLTRVFATTLAGPLGRALGSGPPEACPHLLDDPIRVGWRPRRAGTCDDDVPSRPPAVPSADGASA